MKKNDINRLKDEADIQAVIEHLGIEQKSRGSAIFILCPLPAHNDTHATNCYYKPGWNHVFCQACGTVINAIDLIIYTKGISYGEAADLLWEIEGCPDWYYAKNDVTHKAKPEFKLTNEESSIIGLKKSGVALCPISSSDFKTELHTNYEYYPTVDSYIKCKRNRVNIMEWIDEETFLNLVLTKSHEQYAILKNKLEFHTEMKKISNDKIHDYIIRELKTRISICIDVYQRAKKFKKENSL